MPTIQEQASFWDAWNTRARSGRLPATSQRQGQVIEDVVAALGRSDLEIIDVGCGTGWMSERLARHGRVLGVDITESTIKQASARLPHVRFQCADVHDADLPAGHFDVAVCLEVLAHVADQPSFARRLAELLRPGGLLILATQNRPVLERWSAVAAPDPRQIRRWVDQRELRALLQPCFERVHIRSNVPVGDRGLLRLVNAPRFNSALVRLVPPGRIDGWKERCMLGHTLVATGTKPGGRGVTSPRR